MKTEINTRITSETKNIENEFYMIGICIGIAVIPAIYLYQYLTQQIWFMGLPCMFHTLTGYYCPGCGGTRSVYALLQGQFWKSLCYYPLVPYTLCVYLWFMLSQTAERISRGRIHIGMRVRMCWLWAALIILVLNVLIKNLFLLAGVDLLML